MGFLDRIKKVLKSDDETPDMPRADSLDEKPVIVEDNIFDDGGNGELEDAAGDLMQLKFMVAEGRVEIVLDSDMSPDESNLRVFFERIHIRTDGLTIDGQGHSIDANENGRIFEVFARDVTIRNVTFRNFKNDSLGGVIAVHDGASLTCEGCIFKQSTSQSGGAINNDGDLTCIGCTFENNHARGSAYGASGGAIYNSGTLKCQSGRFISNSSTGYGCTGGAIYNSGPLTLIDCTFEHNHSIEGGAINNHGDLRCEGCTFEDNSAGSGGDAIYNKSFANLIIDGCCFRDNSILNTNFASVFHSEFYNSIIAQGKEEDSSIGIEYSTLRSDKLAVNLNGGFASIHNSTIDCSNDGNAIINSGDLSIVKTKFISLSPILNRNVIRTDNDDLIFIIEQAEGASPVKLMSGDMPEDHRGFAYLEDLIAQGSDEIVLDSDINMHELEQKFYEGGIELERDGMVIDGAGHIIDAGGMSRFFIIMAKNVTLKNITFKNGKHFKMQFVYKTGGGALYVAPGASLKLENCRFTENESRQYAGSIFTKSDLSLENVEFEGCSSNEMGGAIYNCGGSLSFAKCSFRRNSSWGITVYGGAVYNDGGAMSLEGCSFISNSLSVESGHHMYGGAIFNCKGSLDLSDCRFEGNSVEGYQIIPNSVYGYSTPENIEGYAGAIYNDGGKLECLKCVFDGNSSNIGGAIDNNDFASLLECTFRGNVVKGESLQRYYRLPGMGGAIYNTGSMICEGCDFSDNSAVSKSSENLLSGGAIFSDGSLECLDCSFEANHSNDEGDAITNWGSMNLENCRFGEMDRVIE